MANSEKKNQVNQEMTGPNFQYALILKEREDWSQQCA